jgi:hypothetical protein
MFPHESRNSRRGSDVPKGGESNGVASLKFHGWILSSPHGFEREEERGGNGLEDEP